MESFNLEADFDSFFNEFNFKRLPSDDLKSAMKDVYFLGAGAILNEIILSARKRNQEEFISKFIDIEQEVEAYMKKKCSRNPD